MDAILGPALPPKPPANTFSAYDIAEKYNLSYERARKRVADIVNDGKAEFVGTWDRRNYYRLK